jgi:hypothetical protein
LGIGQTGSFIFTAVQNNNYLYTTVFGIEVELSGHLQEFTKQNNRLQEENSPTGVSDLVVTKIVTSTGLLQKS